MEAFDTNKDGKISLEEYLGTYVKKKMFALLIPLSSSNSGLNKR